MNRRPPAPGPVAGLLAVLALVTALPATPQVASDPEPAEPSAESIFSEEISVDLLTVAVRVVSSRGEPLRDLAPEELRIRHRRRELPVVAVEWVSRTGAAVSSGDTLAFKEGYRVTALEPTPLTIFWVQADMHAVRAKGHLRLLPHLRRLLADLPLDGQVAVLSFDSHLKLWQDFTGSRELVELALERSVRFGKRPPPVRDRVGLGRYLDVMAARRAATPEQGLRVTAEALEALPGDKDLVLVGWGLGRYGAGGFRMTPEYPRTLRALDAARTSVFVLDVTDADYHTLEAGIALLASDTGGSYAKTNLFAGQATSRLGRTLSGYYRVTIDRSEMRGVSPRDLNIELVARKGRVLAPGR